MTTETHEQQARDFLTQQLQTNAPKEITHVASFAGEPLENEGDMSLFRFNARIGNDEQAEYWVVSGQTQPNYYPDWDLPADDVYSLHLGTRFMLVMEIAIVHDVDVTKEQRAAITTFIETVAPGETVAELATAAIFRAGDDLLGVFRATIAGENVYILGLDCPPGIYRDVHLPPHVILRRHLGKLIRIEAEQDAAPSRRNYPPA